MQIKKSKARATKARATEAKVTEAKVTEAAKSIVIKGSENNTDKVSITSTNLIRECKINCVKEQ